MAQSKVKFIKFKTMSNLKDWEEELNNHGREGWKVIQIFSAPDGYLTALLRKDD